MGDNKKSVRRLAINREAKLKITFDLDSITSLYASLKMAVALQKSNMYDFDNQIIHATTNEEKEQLRLNYETTALLVKENEQLIPILESFILENT